MGFRQRSESPNPIPVHCAQGNREGGIAQNPGDPAFGDVHFYKEDANLWLDSTYAIPRCASEFGVQSLPLRGTMLRWINATEWAYNSETMVHRQHHPGGVLLLPSDDLPALSSPSTF